MHEVKQFIAETPVSPPRLYPGADMNMGGARKFTATPKSPPTDAFVQEMHLMLDAAKQGVWSAVWAMLDKNPSLINELPNPRKYRLIHQAGFQQNEFALQTLLQRGAKITALTSDGKNVNQILADLYIKKEVRDIIERAYGLEKHHDEVNPLEKRKYYGLKLDAFLQELKEYMSDNDINDDVFMQTLCDDIYITTVSYTHLTLPTKRIV